MCGMSAASTAEEERLNETPSTTRIEALSDGVFAIVLTLMVFQIRIPNISSGDAQQMLWPQLLRQWPEFYSYVISFLLVGIYWVAHHNMYHLIRKSTRPLMWMNLIFLMFVAFVPYSVALVGRYDQIQRMMVLYGVHLTIISGLLYMQWWYVTRRHNLVGGRLNQKYVKSMDFKILAAPGVYMLAIGASFINVRWSKLLYILTIVLYLLPSHMDRIIHER